MNSGSPDVIIGVVPRERFSCTAAAVERLLEATTTPFRVILVDCAMPRRYREALDRVLSGRKNVEVIRVDEYLRPNQARNLVLRACGRSDWICLMDNDVFVEPGWLADLIHACEEERADAAVPLIIEGADSGPVHFDRRLGSIHRAPPWVRGRWIIKEPEFDYGDDRQASRRWQGMVEDHLVLYRPETLARISPFPEDLSTRELVDLSMRLHVSGARVIFEPGVRVIFCPPPPIEPEEREFFAFRWEAGRAAGSNEYVQKKWGIKGLPSSMNFIRERLSLLDD